MAAPLLSAQRVQDLLGVDASTVYRMAADGRLPGVRIGRQWRFPADQIEALLQPAAVPTPAQDAVPIGAGSVARPTPTGPEGWSHAPVPTAAVPEAAPLSPELATATLAAVAPALGVSMVVTDLDGRPLTPIVHPAPAIVARSEDPRFTTACSAEWGGFAAEAHLAPRLQPGRFGFLCAHGFVRDGAALVAMVLAGGIAPEGSDDPDLFHLDAARRAVVLETLPNIAALLSRLAISEPGTDAATTDHTTTNHTPTPT